jgi:hypothetical protein
MVTHADGRAIADHPAVGSSRAHGLAVIGAASAELHAKLLAEVDTGLARLANTLGP